MTGRRQSRIPLSAPLNSYPAQFPGHKRGHKCASRTGRPDSCPQPWSRSPPLPLPIQSHRVCVPSPAHPSPPTSRVRPRHAQHGNPLTVVRLWSEYAYRSPPHASGLSHTTQRAPGLSFDSDPTCLRFAITDPAQIQPSVPGPAHIRPPISDPARSGSPICHAT